MKDLTELVIIIDKSGSMHGLEKDVIGGFNSLIEEQNKKMRRYKTMVWLLAIIPFVPLFLLFSDWSNFNSFFGPFIFAGLIVIAPTFLITLGISSHYGKIIREINDRENERIQQIRFSIYDENQKHREIRIQRFETYINNMKINNNKNETADNDGFQNIENDDVSLSAEEVVFENEDDSCEYEVSEDSETEYCSNCGMQINKTASFCPFCGSNL